MFDGDDKGVNGGALWRGTNPRGRRRLLPSAEELWRKAREYFAWCDDTPWCRVDLVKYQGEATQEAVPLGRPYTVDGLTVFLGVAGSYFRTAEKELFEKVEKKRATPIEEELLDTIQYIKTVIRSQQIEGAAVGVFNASLVARINGLVDRQDVTSNGERVVNVVVRDEKTAKALQNLDELL